MPPQCSLGTRLSLGHPMGPAPHSHCGYIQSGVHSLRLGEPWVTLEDSLIYHSGEHREGSYPIFWKPVKIASLLAQSGAWRASHTHQGLATCDGQLYVSTRATGTLGVWSDVTAPCVCEPFTDDVNVWVSRLSKADCPL